MNIPLGRVTKATDGFVCRLPIGVILTVVVTSDVSFFVFAPRDCQTRSDQMLPKTRSVLYVGIDRTERSVRPSDDSHRVCWSSTPFFEERERRYVTFCLDGKSICKMGWRIPFKSYRRVDPCQCRPAQYGDNKVIRRSASLYWYLQWRTKVKKG